jgi:two-component system OmpR family sensor kinase
MIRSIRGRLQWWYGAVYAVSIIAFGCLIYWRADREVHERAAHHAVTTAQYLDVSLRSLRPEVLRRSDSMSSDSELAGEMLDAFAQETVTEPWFPERPVHQPDRRPPGRQPPENRPPGRRPPDGQTPDRRPEVAVADHFRPDRDRMDRLEFIVRRSDGSLLRQSSGFNAATVRPIPAPDTLSTGTDVTFTRGVVDVLQRGPQGVIIQVQRPIEHDMARLHRFGLQIAGIAVATLLAGLVGGWWISGRILKPIRIISDTAAQISATSLSRRIETAPLDTELVQLGTVLNDTFGRLEQSFGRLTQFTADASHELRTPLAVIQSVIELALSQPRTADSYQQTLEVCLKSSERMRSLIDGLLLLAQADSNRMELRPCATDLRYVAENAVAQSNQKAVSAGIELECTVPDIPVLVFSDVRFLEQVPMNLIDNAVQHSVNGGKILVDVRHDGEDAVLAVRDSGCGIAPEHLPYIFERFYRVDTGRSRKQGGSGLGLAICRSLVEAHGGTLTCESAPGKGSLFCVRLPLITESADS